MLRGLDVHGSPRRVDGLQASKGRALAAALRMIVGCGVAGHGEFSVVVLILTRSPLGPGALTNLQRRNYTRRICRGQLGGFPR